MSGAVMPERVDEVSRSTRALTGTVAQEVWDLIDSDPRQLGSTRLVKRLKPERHPINDRKMTPFLAERSGEWMVAKVIRRGHQVAHLRAEADAAAQWGLAVPDPLGQDERFSWVIRQFVDGQTLVALRHHPDFAANRRNLALLLLERLAEVHALGAHHGDIKPSNVLVTPELSVQLIDFESAQAGGAHAAIRHLTPEFAAPEHFNFGAEVGPPADVFSWALTVVEMYAPGQHPYLTEGQVSADRLSSRYAAGDRALRLPQSLPHALVGALTKALRLDPATRPTAATLLADLRLAAEPDHPTLVMGTGLSTATTLVQPTRVEVGRQDDDDLPEPPLPRSGWTLVVGARGYPGRRELSWQVVVAYGLLGIVLAFVTALVLFVGASIVGAGAG